MFGSRLNGKKTKPAQITVEEQNNNELRNILFFLPCD